MARCFRGTPVYRQFYGARALERERRGCAGITGEQRSVYYTGPCPEADPDDKTNMDACNCGCANGCSGCNGCSDCANCSGCGNCRPHGGVRPEVFAFYADCGLLDVNADETFPLDDSIYSIGSVSRSDCRVVIGHRGRYRAVFTVSGMAQQTMEAFVALRFNGEILPRSGAEIVAEQGEVVQAVGQAEFCAECGDVLQLVASCAVAVYGTPAATLTLVCVE